MVVVIEYAVVAGGSFQIQICQNESWERLESNYAEVVEDIQIAISR